MRPIFMLKIVQRLLTGGEKREEWGITTVVVNSRQGGCPKCAKFVGKVFIDDVYSGGTKADGNYPLLSEAVKQGLFHPRCKDGTSTYYEGITTLEPKPTKQQLSQMEQRETLENQYKYAQRQEKRYNRLAKYSLDKDNKRIAQARADEWRDKKKSIEDKISFSNYSVDYMSNSFRPEYSDTDSIKFNNKIIPVKKVKNSNFDIFTDLDSTRRNKAVRLTEKMLNSINNDLPVNMELPKIVIIDFEKHNFGIDAIGGYDRKTGVLYINSKYDTVNKILAYVNNQKGMFANNTEYAPLLHELGHKYYYDSIENLAKDKSIEYNKAKRIVDDKIANYLHDKRISKSLKTTISEYAQSGYDLHMYTEIIAESFTVFENKYANDLAKLVRE